VQPRVATQLAVIVSIVSGITLGVVAHRNIDLMTSGPDADMDDFAHLIETIRDDYVEPVDDDELFENAMRGIMQGLDAHSAFLDESQFATLTEQTTGRFVGIGIELGLVEGRVTVIAPIDDSPAQHAGLRSGDRLIHVGEDPIKGRLLSEVVSMLRGEPGSTVTLAIQRDGVDETLDFDIIRRLINVNSVRSRELEPGYGYVRISQFQTRTGRDLEGALAELQKDNALTGLVLDLRNNPGGVLQASVAVADTFLEEGLIVYTEGRKPSATLRYSAAGADRLAGAPLAVLINHGSASASEIVAGALQDHGRALIIGTPSFGKGSVQTVVPLDNNRAIKLTTALYFTPSGRSIQEKGIQPDIEVEPEADDAGDLLVAEALRQLKETPRG
jgi:carboxyl-terminal processing protease